MLRGAYQTAIYENKLFAAAEGKKQLSQADVRWLIFAGANIEKRFRNGKTLLLEAVTAKNTKFLDKLLPCQPNLKANWGRDITALHIAAGSGYADGIQLLARNGAEINAKDLDGNTPLHTAVMFQKDYVESVKKLCRFKADRQAKNNESKTPLDIAKEKGRNQEIITLLREQIS